MKFLHYSKENNFSLVFLFLGPTGSGKSFIVFKIIKERRTLIKGDIKDVLYCLPKNQSIEIPKEIQDDPEVVFHEGVPDFERFSKGKSYLVILDDLMSDTGSEILNIFTRQSHHSSVSVVFLVQNIFYGASKFFRSVSLNTHYIILTKNPRDRNQVSSLAVQLYPENVNFIREAFADATKLPYTYLMFDLSQTCTDELRVRTNLFSDDSPQNVIYIPKKPKKSKKSNKNQ